MFKHLYIGFCTVAFLTAVAPAQQLVSNGTFDTDASGWTTQNVSSGAYRSTKGNPGGFFTLDSIPSSATDPIISQAVSGFVIGRTYTVSGDYELSIDRGGGSPGAFSLGVALDGVYLFDTATPSDFAWHTFSFSYTPSSSSAVLSLAAQRNDTGASYGIDNISIVPEPSPAWLLVIGFMILLFGRSSRRSNAPNPAMELTGSARHGLCCQPAEPPAQAAPCSAGSSSCSR